MRILLLLPALLLTNITFSQEKNIVLKPYWEIGDSRQVLVNTEMIISRNDSVLKTVKGKFEGLIEVNDRTVKDFTVTISQTYFPDYNNYNLFVAGIMETNERVDMVVKLDKKGVPVELNNIDELKDLFIEGQVKKARAEKKGMKKAEIEQLRTTLEQEINQGRVFESNILAHAGLLLNMFDQEFPVTGSIKTEDEVLAFNRYGVLSEPLSVKKEWTIKEQKGTKSVVSLVQQYEDISQFNLVRGFAPSPEETSFGTPAVTETYLTTFDSKSGWPQKKSEESIMVYGPYKVITRFNYKFNKED